MSTQAVAKAQTARRTKPVRARRIVKEVLFYLVVALILTVVMVPFLWMVSGSFKTTLELQSADVLRPGHEPRFIPREPTLENYIGSTAQYLCSIILRTASSSARVR